MKLVSRYGTRRLQTAVFSDGRQSVLRLRWAADQPALQSLVPHPDGEPDELLLPEARGDGVLLYEDARLPVATLLPRIAEHPGAAQRRARELAGMLARLHRPLAAGRLATARLDRVAVLWATGDETPPALAGHGLLARWREDLGDDWERIGAAVAEARHETAARWWVLGDATLGAIWCADPASPCRAIYDGHAGRGPREFDVARMVGEMTELASLAVRCQDPIAAAELQAAQDALLDSLPADYDRGLARRLAGASILLHALDFLEFMGYHAELQSYGVLAGAAVRRTGNRGTPA